MNDLTPPRLLVVDDDSDLRDLIAGFLRDHHLEVETAADAEGMDAALAPAPATDRSRHVRAVRREAVDAARHDGKPTGLDQFAELHGDGRCDAVAVRAPPGSSVTKKALAFGERQAAPDGVAVRAQRVHGRAETYLGRATAEPPPQGHDAAERHILKGDRCRRSVGTPRHSPHDRA